MLLLWVRGCSVCVLYVVCDDSLVENGAVGGNGAKEVCNAACGGAVSCYCACISAHDALAAVNAAQFACVAVGSGSPDGVASRVRVPNR